MVVLLPDPVMPASRIMPWANVHKSASEGGRCSASKFGILLFTSPGDQTDVPHLLQDVDAKSPRLVPYIEHIGKVYPAVFLEYAPTPLLQINHRED